MTTPEGEGAQSGAEGTQSGAGEATGTGSGTTETGSTAQSGGETQQQTADMVNRSELDRVLERMRAADQRADKAANELRQLRDKDLPEIDKLKRDYEDSQTQVSKLQETNTALALKVAFLSDNTYTWHNPERALKLVDLTQVEIDADGNVSGLKDALKALATSDAYLIKQEATQETKPSGTAPANNGGSTGAKPSTKGMAARIPALNTRVKR